MADRIMGQRFYGARNKAGWHMKGFTDDLEHTASEAFDLIGHYNVMKLPLQTVATRQDGTHVPTPYFGLVRGPVPEDPQEQVFGVVSDDYRLVTPQDVVDLWDDRIRKPVETMMALKDGRVFVVTCRLPKFDVRGDEIENYLSLYNYMDGSTASGANLSPVRVVCHNTLTMSIQGSNEKVNFRHDSLILQRMGGWMEDAVQRAEARLPEIQQAFDALAAYSLTRTRPESPREIKHVLTAAYPSMPRYEADPLLTDEQNEERTKRREQEIRVIDQRRVQAFELFKGEGTGMKNVASYGTLWGLYNAVTELEDWKGGSKGAALSHSILFGERADTKSRAFDACLAVASGNAAV